MAEELDFILNYDIKYRLGRVTEGEEEDEAMPAKKKPSITTRASSPRASSPRASSPRASSPRAISPLIAELRGLILSARHQAASTINSLQVLTNFETVAASWSTNSRERSGPGMAPSCSRNCLPG